MSSQNIQQQTSIMCGESDGGEPCKELATATYVWPWGKSGTCCPRHQVILQQRAHSLKRQITFTALNPGAQPAPTRDERIQFRAKVGVLEAELSEARERGMQLYRGHEALQAQLRVALLSKQELEAQLADAHAQLERMRVENGELREAAARENDELQQLRAFVAADQELEGEFSRTVVEGGQKTPTSPEGLKPRG